MDGKTSKKELKEKLKQERERNKKNEFAKREQIINSIRIRDGLWNRKLKEYRNREVNETLWEEVATENNMTKENVKKIWKGLMDQFRDIFNVITVKCSGDAYKAESDYKQVKWAYFQQLLFLKDVLERRETSSNYEPTTFQGAINESSSSCQGNETLILESDGRDYVLEIPNNQEEISEIDDTSNLEPSDVNENMPSTSSKLTDYEKNISGKSTNSKEIPTQPPSTSYKKLKKRKPSNVSLNNDDLLKEMCMINRELTKTPSEKFAEYASVLMQQLSSEKRRKCELHIIQYINEQIDSELNSD